MITGGFGNYFCKSYLWLLLNDPAFMNQTFYDDRDESPFQTPSPLLGFGSGKINTREVI